MHKIILSLALLSLSSIICYGQSDDYKYEVGIHATTINGRNYDSVNENLGGGIRLGYNLMKNLGLEAELNGFPKTGYRQQNLFQGQFGIKAGVSWKRFGFFGKVRPGFVRTGDDQLVFATVPRTITTNPSPGITITDIFLTTQRIDTRRIVTTNFSADIGGVVEFRASKRIFLRFDLGDTVIRKRETRDQFLPITITSPPPNLVTISRTSTVLASPVNTTHNLQTSLGVGLRF